MSGYVGDLSVEQADALAELRARLLVAAEEDDRIAGATPREKGRLLHFIASDPLLLRFLRARKFDLEKATGMGDAG